MDSSVLTSYIASFFEAVISPSALNNNNNRSAHNDYSSSTSLDLSPKEPDQNVALGAYLTSTSKLHICPVRFGQFWCLKYFVDVSKIKLRSSWIYLTGLYLFRPNDLKNSKQIEFLTFWLHALFTK